MESDRSKVKNFFDKVVSNMSFLGAVWIVGLMLIIVIDVCSRNFIGKPLTGTPEIVKNSIVGITFLQLAHVLREGRHIRSTVFLDRLSKRGKAIVEIISCLLGMIVFAFLLYSEWSPTWDALENGDYEGEGALRVPTFPTHLLILIGSFFMFLQFSVLLLDHLRLFITRRSSVNSMAEYQSPTTSSRSEEV